MVRSATQMRTPDRNRDVTDLTAIYGGCSQRDASRAGMATSMPHGANIHACDQRHLEFLDRETPVAALVVGRSRCHVDCAPPVSRGVAVGSTAHDDGARVEERAGVGDPLDGRHGDRIVIGSHETVSRRRCARCANVHTVVSRPAVDGRHAPTRRHDRSPTCGRSRSREPGRGVVVARAGILGVRIHGFRSCACDRPEFVGQFDPRPQSARPVAHWSCHGDDRRHV
ncbi:MAG: hypothetical protein JWQ11_4887 [Rhizobacter sp.]|nr:hypothetical protein [Rhizobacter sp.]